MVRRDGIGRSGCLPPAARRLDDAQGRIEGRVYIEIGGVEQGRILGPPQWRGGAVGVAGVAAADVVEDGLEGHRIVLGAKLQMAPAGARLRGWR